MRKFVIFRGKCMTSLKVVLQTMEFLTAILHSSFSPSSKRVREAYDGFPMRGGGDRRKMRNDGEESYHLERKRLLGLLCKCQSPGLNIQVRYPRPAALPELAPYLSTSVRIASFPRPEFTRFFSCRARLSREGRAIQQLPLIE